MKIRNGFVTNSSSTNFIIMAKDEITMDFLCEKLGFSKNSPMYDIGKTLCEDIINGGGSLRHEDVIDYDSVKNVFGVKTANKWRDWTNRGFNYLCGYTSNDQDAITSFFTMDSFEIKEKDFYVNGKDCIW